MHFPIKIEEFIAVQEAVIGRSLENVEREATAAFIPVINTAYEDGQKTDLAVLGETLDKLDHFLFESEGVPALVQFIKATRHWVAYAYDQGRRDALKGVQV